MPYIVPLYSSGRYISQKHSQAVWSIYHSPLCLSRIPPNFLRFKYKTPAIHHLCPTLYHCTHLVGIFHKSIARLCGQFITHLFACPEYPPNFLRFKYKTPTFHHLCPTLYHCTHLVGIFHKSIARLCGQFITHLFACPEYPPNFLRFKYKTPTFHHLCPTLYHCTHLVGIFHKSTARLCGQFITHLFACPEYPPNFLRFKYKTPTFHHLCPRFIHCTHLVGIFHKTTARLCRQFITLLFACPEYPPTSLGLNTKRP